MGTFIGKLLSGEVSKCTEHIELFKQFSDVRLMGNKLLPYIAFLASNLGSMMSNDAIRDALGSTAFISNHTTASSTDKLCMRMLEEFGAQINNVRTTGILP